MPASASDKARKSYSYLQKTLSVGINDIVTTLTPNNVTNIPTDTGVSFVIDRVNSSGALTPLLRELMTGVVSGGTIAGLVRGEQGTTAQSHSANAVIEFVNSGEMWNDLIDFMLQDHSNPNGNHKTLTDDNGNEWLERGSVASAVNQIKVSNAATGNAAKIEASGGDTNIDVRIDAKGSGKIDIRGTSSQIDYFPPRVGEDEAHFDYVASGGVWSGDAYASTRNASMTALVCYINGRRISISAVTARSFTASKDTYVDVLDNADGTGTLVYTEVANNAASPALAANSIRIGIVVTGAGNIAAAASINQGQEDRILPIASSIPYAVTDSLGNLICPRDPNRRILGYRQIVSDWTSATGTNTQVTGLTVPVIVPTGRKIKATFQAGASRNDNTGGQIVLTLHEGTVSGTTNQKQAAYYDQHATANEYNALHCELAWTPASSSVNINGATAMVGNGTLSAASNRPVFVLVELA